MSRAELIFYLIVVPPLVAVGWWARRESKRLERELEAEKLHSAFRRASKDDDKPKS